MPEGVVDCLEIVEVQEEDGGTSRVITAPSKGVFEEVDEQGTIRETRERIVECLPRQLLLECLPFRDVMQSQQQGAVLLSADAHADSLHRQPSAVPVAYTALGASARRQLRRAQHREDRGHIGRGHDVVDAHVHQRLGGVAQGGRQRWAHRANGSAVVEHDRGIGRVRHERVEGAWQTDMVEQTRWTSGDIRRTRPRPGNQGDQHGPDGQPLEGATFGRARSGKDDGRDPATDTDEEQHEDERRLEPHREARQGLRRKRPWQCLFGALHPSRVCSSTWGIHRVGAHIGGSVRFGCPHSHHPEVPGSAVLGKGGAYAGSRC